MFRRIEVHYSTYSDPFKLFGNVEGQITEKPEVAYGPNAIVLGNRLPNYEFFINLPIVYTFFILKKIVWTPYWTLTKKNCSKLVWPGNPHEGPQPGSSVLDKQIDVIILSITVFNMHQINSLFVKNFHTHGQKKLSPWGWQFQKIIVHIWKMKWVPQNHS